MNNKEIILRKLDSLSKSKFRSSFKLNNSDKKYVMDNGINKIIEHAYEIINKRLAPLNISNDGKQTPMKGHPVFISQHATGTCCRECLYKWHKISKNKELTNNEINFVINIITLWIIKEIKS